MSAKREVEKLRALVKTLSGRERQIIVMRYGLAGGAPLTQQQVAGCLGINRSYVSRIEKKGGGSAARRYAGIAKAVFRRAGKARG